MVQFVGMVLSTFEEKNAVNTKNCGDRGEHNDFVQALGLLDQFVTMTTTLDCVCQNMFLKVQVFISRFTLKLLEILIKYVLLKLCVTVFCAFVF